MPWAEAARTTWSAEPVGTPGAISPGAEIDAGWRTGPSGRREPSGRRTAVSPAAVAVGATMLAVQAAESTASGTRAVARCHRGIVPGVRLRLTDPPLPGGQRPGEREVTLTRKT